uniref:Acyl_transf_3 domain-containing protein n=1 Tax=Macrostomum lignano TaxID=282301 RepID=A0A1I8FCI7_9PLAT
MILKAFSGQFTVSGGAAAACCCRCLPRRAGGEVSYNSFWRRLDSFRPVADAADGGVSRPTLEAAARLLSADGASLRQAALEALETFVRAEQAAAFSWTRTPSHRAALAYGARLWLGNYDQCMAVGRSDPIEISTAPLMSIAATPCRSAAPTACWPLRKTGGSGRPAGGPRVQRASLGPLLAGQPAHTLPQINNLTQLLLSPLQKLLPANAVSSGAASGYSVPATSPSPAALDAGRCLLVNEDEEADAETATADGISAAAAADGGGHLVNGIANGGHETASHSFSAIAADRLPLPLRLLLCFSVLTTPARSRTHSEGTLTCVHGLRFLSMSWVILGHTYYFAFGSLNNMGQLYAGWQNDWTFQVIANATVSVDSFFVLSGPAVHLPVLPGAAAHGRRASQINWLMFYVHSTSTRARCTRRRRPPSTPQCPTDWWKNALYINNLFSAESGA